MFLKKLQRRKNGKNHVYWALVESCRTPKGPRNRLVAYLGELKPHERKGWARLASTLGGTPPAMAHKALFAEEGVGEPVPENVTVDVRGVRELARIKCSEVILPTHTGRELQLWCITRPDKWQQALLERLRLDRPPRLGRPKWRNLIETGSAM